MAGNFKKDWYYLPQADFADRKIKMGLFPISFWNAW